MTSVTVERCTGTGITASDGGSVALTGCTLRHNKTDYIATVRVDFAAAVPGVHRGVAAVAALSGGIAAGASAGSTIWIVCGAVIS